MATSRSMLDRLAAMGQQACSACSSSTVLSAGMRRRTIVPQTLPAIGSSHCRRMHVSHPGFAKQASKRVAAQTEEAVDEGAFEEDEDDLFGGISGEAVADTTQPRKDRTTGRTKEYFIETSKARAAARQEGTLPPGFQKPSKDLRERLEWDNVEGEGARKPRDVSVVHTIRRAVTRSDCEEGLDLVSLYSRRVRKLRPESVDNIVKHLCWIKPNPYPELLLSAFLQPGTSGLPYTLPRLRAVQGSLLHKLKRASEEELSESPSLPGVPAIHPLSSAAEAEVAAAGASADENATAASDTSTPVDPVTLAARLSLLDRMHIVRSLASRLDGATNSHLPSDIYLDLLYLEALQVSFNALDPKSPVALAARTIFGRDLATDFHRTLRSAVSRPIARDTADTTTYHTRTQLIHTHPLLVQAATTLLSASGSTKSSSNDEAQRHTSALLRTAHDSLGRVAYERLFDALPTDQRPAKYEWNAGASPSLSSSAPAP